jgi:hypothetical protein
MPDYVRVIAGNLIKGLDCDFKSCSGLYFYQGPLNGKLCESFGKAGGLPIVIKEDTSATMYP